MPHYNKSIFIDSYFHWLFQCQRQHLNSFIHSLISMSIYNNDSFVYWKSILIGWFTDEVSKRFHLCSWPVLQCESNSLTKVKYLHRYTILWCQSFYATIISAVLFWKERNNIQVSWSKLKHCCSPDFICTAILEAILAMSNRVNIIKHISRVQMKQNFVSRQYEHI